MRTEHKLIKRLLPSARLSMTCPHEKQLCTLGLSFRTGNIEVFNCRQGSYPCCQSVESSGCYKPYPDYEHPKGSTHSSLASHVAHNYDMLTLLGEL